MTEYGYDASDRVTEVTAKENGTQAKQKNEYTYSHDRLSEVKHNTSGTASDVVYTFGYDSLGRNTQIRVGNGTESGTQTILSEREYTEDRSGQLKKETLGNGGCVSYTYDDFKRLTETQEDNDSSRRVEYSYGNSGTLEKVTNVRLGRETSFESDLAGRPIKKEIRDGNNSLLYRTVLGYNECELASVLRETVKNGSSLSTFTTEYSYDRDNRPRDVYAPERDDAELRV